MPRRPAARSATLTMKKSRKVMNVPASTTSNGPQPGAAGSSSPAAGRLTVSVVI
jgi:hypothetical protein